MKKSLFENIIITTDFSKVATNAPEYGLEPASAFKSKVTIPNTYEIPDFPCQELLVMDGLKALCYNAFLFEEKTSFVSIPQKQILLRQHGKHIKQNKADLLCMNATRKSFLKKLFTGSLTERMAYHTRIPFLAFQTPQK